MITTFNLPTLRRYPHHEEEYLLQVVTPPSEEPVTYDEFCAQAKIDQTYDAALALTHVRAAREYVEIATRKVFMQATYSVSFNTFHNYDIRIPLRPVTAVNSVTYYDTSGNFQSLNPIAQFWFNQKSCFSTIRPVNGISWPLTQIGRPNAVTVNFVAGSATKPYQVQPTAKAAILLLAAHLYKYREATSEKAIKEIPLGLQTLIGSLGAPEL